MGRAHDNPEYRRNAAILRARARLTQEPCARCDQPIDYTASYLQPHAFTAGHITPAALGGSHSLSNLRPEHRHCNLTHGGQLGNRLRWTQPTWTPSRPW